RRRPAFPVAAYGPRRGNGDRDGQAQSRRRPWRSLRAAGEQQHQHSPTRRPELAPIETSSMHILSSEFTTGDGQESSARALNHTGGRMEHTIGRFAAAALLAALTAGLVNRPAYGQDSRSSLAGKGSNSRSFDQTTDARDLTTGLTLGVYSLAATGV